MNKRILVGLSAVLLASNFSFSKISAIGPDIVESAVEIYIGKHPEDSDAEQGCREKINKSHTIADHMIAKGYILTDTILGFGCNGICWLAKDPEKKLVVLKFTSSKCHTLRGTHVQYLGDEIIYKRFARRGISLPKNSCHIFDCIKIPIENSDRFDFDTCVVMNFISGESLESYIECNEFTSSDVIKWIIEGLKPTLDILHNSNLVHHDIGEHNMLIDSNSNVTLVDYGKSFPYEMFYNIKSTKKRNPSCPTIEKTLEADLNAVKGLVEYLIKNANYVSNEGHSKLIAALSTENFDDLYKNLA